MAPVCPFYPPPPPARIFPRGRARLSGNEDLTPSRFSLPLDQGGVRAPPSATASPHDSPFSAAAAQTESSTPLHIDTVNSLASPWPEPGPHGSTPRLERSPSPTKNRSEPEIKELTSAASAPTLLTAADVASELEAAAPEAAPPAVDAMAERLDAAAEALSRMLAKNPTTKGCGCGRAVELCPCFSNALSIDWPTA